MTPQIKENLRVYAGTYLIAGLFVFITLLQSFVAQFNEFKEFTPAQLSAVTNIKWIFATANMLISAGVVILAFLNQSLARANVKRDAAAAGNTPSPFPPTIK